MDKHKWTDAEIKHLEFIQGVINRMGRNSFWLKGWSVTLVAAVVFFLARLVNNGSTQSIALLMLPFCVILVFWLLDAFYLERERAFVNLYKRVVQHDDVDVFDMRIPSLGLRSFFHDLISPTILGFYIPLAIICAVLIGSL